VCCGLVLSGWAFICSSSADIQYAGVNLSGAEFGQGNLPGTFGSDYTWPTSAEITYYRSKGMNFIRLPFRWERLQHTNSAVLDSTELGRMNTFVTNATSQGFYVLLDPHNFMRYYPNPRGSFQTTTNGLVGTTSPIYSTSFADFSNFWYQVAAIYKTNDHVFFGLNNEPANMQETQLVTALNLAIASIRAAGATNLIFVPGNRYTGAWTWSQADGNGAANSVAMLGIVDPGSNLLFEVHQYLDQDGSGTHTNIGYTYSTNMDGNFTNIFVPDPDIGLERLTNFTAWAGANHVKGFLGEFAVADSMMGSAAWQIGGEALTNMLGYIQTHSDVWLGWAWWGGGPWWGNYMFAIDPNDIGLPAQSDQPVMTVAKQFFPLPVLDLQLVNNSHFQYLGPQGFVYQPQVSADLVNWVNSGPAITNVPPPGSSGTNGPFTVTMTVGTGSQGFYRVRVSHAP